ncbi:hypothetical protein A2482_02145 [Candidatus Falkowbacteria bacterium RIFOXYC2_FULL_48_21]|uniref:Uncharacterized protein n=1 Tax=Candidatus Falkowbacteria bacterium RIFOXYC2_FULL_48_21 TaxID=1798005 RepID=A0A1F5T6X1_9BACT|nr:MAG: hypothetical protein A2482_02145 [Candidatus Falkowbacteria bacterium RIFOXYC2_FULL_48_21]
MAKTEFIRDGICAKCGGKTAVNLVTSWPFPDDERSEVVETCASCDFGDRRNFSSTDQVTSFNQSCAEESVNNRVKAAISNLRELIAAYPVSFVRPDMASVAAALKLLERGDFSRLYVELEALGKSPIAEIRFDSMAEIRSAAQADRQRGRTMDEWHENEARVEASSQQAEEKVFDSVAELVRLVEKSFKEQK